MENVQNNTEKKLKTTLLFEQLTILSCYFKFSNNACILSQGIVKGFPKQSPKTAILH